MEEPWNWDALLEAEPPVRQRDALDDVVAKVLQVHTRDRIERGEQEAKRWTGTLRVPAEEALEHLTPIFARVGFTALIQDVEGEDEVAVVAVPGLVQPTSSRLWLAVLLFVLTVASTMFIAGAQSIENGRIVFNWSEAILFSGTLMSILLAHELGHFVASRRLGVAVSYPFFIPMPLFIFGTMGAFIQMKEPPPDRRALFNIGVAGPLAGLVLAIPLTFIGLTLSTVEPIPTVGSYYMEGNSLLYGAMKFLIFGQWLPSNGVDVMLHPMAFAGWAGMLVTALNLLPAGQLDGGHVIFGLLGKRWGQRVTYAVIGVLLLFGFVWDGWWIWALLIFFLAGRHAPILNEVTPLGPRQRMLGIITLILFILLFTPIPLIVVQ